MNGSSVRTRARTLLPPAAADGRPGKRSPVALRQVNVQRVPRCRVVDLDLRAFRALRQLGRLIRVHSGGDDRRELVGGIERPDAGRTFNPQPAINGLDPLCEAGQASPGSSRAPPVPSSLTRIVTRPGWCSTSNLAPWAPLCLAAFVSSAAARSKRSSRWHGTGARAGRRPVRPAGRCMPRGRRGRHRGLRPGPVDGSPGPGHAVR